ncbi:hypothetical protein ACFUJR_31720 [Streptomyces sp. NPDC057271]|uniref:hypothetical protein n=1 Tax=Streptomyces sp. NPDC057271 TaxID=3346078 RepID=UPI0036296727
MRRRRHHRAGAFVRADPAPPASEARLHDPRVEEVGEAYRKTYGQESVARLDEPARADF